MKLQWKMKTRTLWAWRIHWMLLTGRLVPCWLFSKVALDKTGLNDMLKDHQKLFYTSQVPWHSFVGEATRRVEVVDQWEHLLASGTTSHEPGSSSIHHHRQQS